MTHGWFTYPLSKIVRHVFAIDIDRALLDAASIRIAERGGAQNIEFIEGDAYDIAKVVSEPIDFVFLANAFHGVPDKTRLSRVVHDVLKPGAYFAIVNWHTRPREETTVLGQPRGPATNLRMTPEQTVNSVTPAGLILTKCVEVSPYHYGTVFKSLPR